MSIKIKLKPIKRIFFNPSNGYKVLSCEPVGSYPNLLRTPLSLPPLWEDSHNTFNRGKYYVDIVA